MNIQRSLLRFWKHIPARLVQRFAGEPLEIDGNRLDPHLQLLAQLAKRRERPITNLEKYRPVASKLFAMLNGPRRANVGVQDQSFVGPASELPIRIYSPRDPADDLPAILFFHQGGLVLLDLDTCDTFCTIMADECRARVISLDYRLCPENEFPAPIDDALGLWDHVQRNSSKYGIDPHRVAVAGDSAGGLISAVLCQQRKRLGGIQPVGQLLVYPWLTTETEATGSMESCADTFPLNREMMEFFGEQVFPSGKNADSPLANPLFADDLTGLPPAIVATAGFDPIRDQGDAYADRLKGSHVPTKHHCFGHLCHGFLGMGNVSKSVNRAAIKLAQELRQLL